MVRHRSQCIAFKRQVAGEFIAGDTLHTLAKRHDVSRQLIQEYEAKIAKIATLERMVGRQALELELLKRALKYAPRPESVTTSVVTGPPVSPLAEGAN